jgi:tetrapyrrole methylase family protein/MazG family protein
MRSDLKSAKKGEGMRRLEAIVSLLRSPKGCPWDKKQTLASMKKCLAEETQELLEVMDSDDIEHHREELGDVLLQVVFQAQLRHEDGHFDFDGVAHGICDKLVRRHPHVFGDVKVSGVDDVLKNWKAIKRKEKRM